MSATQEVKEVGAEVSWKEVVGARVRTKEWQGECKKKAERKNDRGNFDFFFFFHSHSAFSSFEVRHVNKRPYDK